MKPPTENLIRMVALERAGVSEDGNTLTGYPVVFNTWTEIDSWEGTFKERILPGALTKTLRERGDQVKVLFNHGMDPQLGDKPLGVPKVQKPDERGLYVEVELDQARSVQEEILPRLRSGSIDGMSFRFSVVDEEWSKEHTERTIKELKLYEYGPVTWPAYQATTVGIRSLSDFNRYRQELKEAASTVPETAASTFDQRNRELEEVRKWLTMK